MMRVPLLVDCSYRAHGRAVRSGRPKCVAEAELGARATRRFAELLNAGAFAFEPTDRSHAQYGRALFVVTRGGESVGGVLVAEGLAEEWRGFRRGWC